jgi:tetratricopeptide (TPR) repeat protein
MSPELSNDPHDSHDDEDRSEDHNDTQPPEDLPDLNLPEDYDERFVPTPEELQQAALNALHDKQARLLLSQENPDYVVDHLDDFTELIHAASQLKGEHQAKAILLGLALELQYWVKNNRLDDWIHLILPLLSTARDIEDDTLYSRLYQTWGIYLYMTHKPSGAIKAMEVALETAEDAGNKPLGLSIRVEQFNIEARHMFLEEVQRKAAQLLDEARGMDRPYLMGRVFLTLARAHNEVPNRAQVFDYAQQALVYFLDLNIYGMAASAMNLMMSALQTQVSYIATYRQRQMDLFESLVQRSANPRFKAAMFYQRALEHFHVGHYNDARRSALRARLEYLAIDDLENVAGLSHLLGKIQSKRHCWHLARRHLDRAITLYAEQKRASWVVHAHNERAYIHYEQGNYRRAVAALQRVLDMAHQLSDPEQRAHLIRVIQNDIDAAQRQLRETQPE